MRGRYRSKSGKRPAGRAGYHPHPNPSPLKGEGLECLIRYGSPRRQTLNATSSTLDYSRRSTRSTTVSAHSRVRKLALASTGS